MHKERVLSGMRTTGELHLGHYHGVLKNWLTLQHQYDCIFLVADWHALTTHYADTRGLHDLVFDNVVTWLSVGINPSLAHIAIQSMIPEHAILNLLLSMITPVGWLERVPTYKEQQTKLADLASKEATPATVNALIAQYDAILKYLNKVAKDLESLKQDLLKQTYTYEITADVDAELATVLAIISDIRTLFIPNLRRIR